MLPEFFLVPRLPRLPPHMAPLTSPHDCDSGIDKSQKIMELKQHISNFYWIRDEGMVPPQAILLVLTQSDPRI